ncbi:MAG TPA: ATP-binding protein [Chloroflexota bacterium]|nr:ATP-binding protein [Chloroflexota bacterium]
MSNGSEGVLRAATSPLTRLRASLGLRPAAAAYVAAVILLGSVAFIAACVAAGSEAGRFFLIGSINSPYSWVGVAIFLFLAPFASMAVILIPEEGGERSRQSLSAAVVLASVVVFPVYMAVLILSVSTLVEQLGQRAAYGRRPVYRILFNVSEITLSTGAAALVFQALSGRTYLLHPQLPQTSWNAVMAVLGAVAVAYVTSYGLTIGAVSLSTGVPVNKLFAKSHRNTILPEATAAVMGVLFAYLWLTDPPLSPIALMPLAVIYLAFKNFVRLQEVDRLKSNFISEVSHELRTPLSAILASSELLFHHSAELAPDDVSELSRSTYESSNHLFRLVENLLNATTLQSGTFQIHVVPVTVDELVAEALVQVQPFLDSKNQTVELEVPEDLPEVLADPRHVVQVLINLLTNASKYSNPQTMVRIVGTAIPGAVRIAVVDHGVGIPEDEQAQIFERFYRAQSNRVTSVVGSGLGLTIVKSVVDLHGGEVGVSSLVGVGSEFWFTLPRAETGGTSE